MRNWIWAVWVALLPFLPGLARGGDGVIVVRGDNGSGQGTVPSPDSGFVAVAAGIGHNLGLGGTLAGACCHNDGACSFIIQENCPTPAVWQGEGSFCTPNPCPPGGACCELDELCTVLLAQSCAEPSVWQGAGVPCDPNPCLMGACCLAAECDFHTEAGCASRAGTYQGNGTLCEPDPCPTSSADGGAGILSLSVRAVPSPSAGVVRILYQVPKSTEVTLRIYTASGRLVRELMRGSSPARSYSITWDGKDDAGRDLPAGVYLTRVQAGGKVMAGKAVLAR